MTKARGRPPHDDQLTPAEWSVVEWVRHGLTNRQIAERRGIGLDAVKFHVGNALAKLGLALPSGSGHEVGIALIAHDGLSTQRQFYRAESRYVGVEVRFDL